MLRKHQRPSNQVAMECTHGYQHCIEVASRIGRPWFLAELIVQVLLRDHTKWTGTASQLVSENVLPRWLKWPKEGGIACWQDPRFSYYLMQAAPNMFELRRTLKADGDDWIASARAY